MDTNATKQVFELDISRVSEPPVVEKDFEHRGLTLKKEIAVDSISRRADANATKQVFELDISRVSEPPVVEKGFELIVQIPRGSGKVPKGWKETLDERSLAWKKKEIGDGILMLSFRTVSYPEFERLCNRFLTGMPWSREVTQYWKRAYTSVEITSYLDDQMIKQQERDREEIKTPAALVRGITFDADRITQFREMRSRIEKQKRVQVEEWRQQYFAIQDALSSQQQIDYAAAVEQGETRTFEVWVQRQPQLPAFTEWQRALEAGEEPRLLLPAPEPWVDEERLAKDAADAEAREIAEAEERERREEERRAKRAREYAATQVDESELLRQDMERGLIAERKAAEREAAENAKWRQESLQQIPNTVRWFFEDNDEGHHTFEQVVDSSVRKVVGQDVSDEEKEMVRTVIDQLIKEGTVREDMDGFQATQGVGDESE